MIEYEEEYYIRLNSKLCRWELVFWKGTSRLVWSKSYDDDTEYDFKTAKKLIERVKRSIEKEPYRREWEYEPRRTASR